MTTEGRFTGTRRDPFRNFNFRIKFGDKTVAACRKMSGLDATVNVVEFRAGDSLLSNVERSPGRVEYQAVTFEAGKTNNTVFEDWARTLVPDRPEGLRKREPDFRRNVVIEVRDIDNSPVLKYQLFDAWVTKITALPELNADGNDTIIETLEITHEGFKRLPLEGGGDEGEGGEDEEAAENG